MAPTNVGLVLLLSIQFLSSSAIELPTDPAMAECTLAYKTFYACVLQCYRDSFGVKCTGDDPCTDEPHIGPFKRKQRFPSTQVEDSFYCITKGCNSQVPKNLCGSTPMNISSDPPCANIDNSPSSDTYNGDHANGGSHDDDNCDHDCIYYCDDSGNSNKGQKKDRRNAAASQSSGTANSRSNSKGAEAGAEAYSSSGSYENSGSNPSSGGNPKNTIENNKYNSFMNLIKRLMLKSNLPTYPTTRNVGSTAATTCDSTDVETTTTDTTTDSYSTATETTATDTTTDCYSTATETTATDTTTDCYSTETETTATDTTTDSYSTETETTTTDTTTDCYSTETETTTTTDFDDSTVASTFPKNEEGNINHAPASSSSWSSAQSKSGSISNGNSGYNNFHTPEVDKNYNWNSQPNIQRPYGDNTHYFMPYSSLASNGNPNYLNGWVSNAQQSLLPDQTKVLNFNNMYNKFPNSNTQSIEVPNTQNKQILPQKNMENTQQIFWSQNQLSNAQHPTYHYPERLIPLRSQSYPQNPFFQSTPFVRVSKDVTDNGQPNSVVHTAAISDVASGSNAFNGDKSGSNTQTWIQPQMQSQNANSGYNFVPNRYSWVHGAPPNPQPFLISETQQDETRDVTNNGQPTIAHSAAISDSVSGNVFYGVNSGGNTQPQQIQNQNAYFRDNSGITHNRYSWMRGSPSNPQQFFIKNTQQDETVVHKNENAP